MKGFAIIILIVIFFWLIWPLLSRWLKRKAMQKMENYIRASMGMPPNYNSRRKNKNKSEKSRQPHPSRPEPLIPKEYAEDVEYVETIDYSNEKTVRETANNIETYHESQISDVEWTEIKSFGDKQDN